MGENFTTHSPKVCKAIMNVVDESLEANLKEEIDLTIEAKLKGKYEKSEIVSYTQKYHDNIKTGVDAVDTVRI